MAAGRWKQRMGEGEDMAQGFIGQAVSARRKESRRIWAGLAAFHKWRRWRDFMSGSAFGSDWRKESVGRRKEMRGRRKERKKKALTGRARGAVSEEIGSRRGWLAGAVGWGADAGHALACGAGHRVRWSEATGRGRNRKGRKGAAGPPGGPSQE